MAHPVPKAAEVSPFAIAIIADAHFHDATADFGSSGLLIEGRKLALRSWKDTRSGPRAINETAMALTAALERVVADQIRHVILAGDYTDDGQVANTRSLATLLGHYHKTHGLRFYVIPGNHDVFGPQGKHVSTRFVAGPDTTVLVTSDPEVATTEPGAVLTPAMRCEGQPAALLRMAQFGVFRHSADLHWESPFGLSDAPEARQYDAVAADGSVTHRLMDASYLVEPEPGLWLLMLDANVFEPRPGRSDPTRKKAFLDPADAGWTAVLRVKPFLLPWIADVSARAVAGNKTLITVSHYPVLDPFRDRAGSEAALFGRTTSLRRTPDKTVGNALIAAGLHWHAGGHMHINATTTIHDQTGRLTDISIPSLSAFPPAFKILQASPHKVAVETVLLHDLPADPALHVAYQMQGRHAPPLGYGNFLLQQFRCHVTEHVLPRDWPPDVLEAVKSMDCAMLRQMLMASEAKLSAEDIIPTEVLALYPALDFIVDAYVIRAAGPLAQSVITQGRITICHMLVEAFGDDTADPKSSHADFIKRFLSVLKVSLHRMSIPQDVIWEKQVW